MTLALGTRLGPYEIQAALGAGGMGEVYRARDTRLERTVAIKVLAASLNARPETRKRFEREARALSSLSHPHICTLHDIGCQDGVDYLVMEYLEGETLEQRLNKGPLAADQVLRYGIEITDALEKAHRQNMVHRDLKPGNIMLTKAGAKLLDFGLARLITRPAPLTEAPSQLGTQTRDNSLTEEGVILGTFQYMAPEQLEGKEADARTDIFALGAVLYEMVTGRPAFVGKSRASLIAAVLSSEPPPISALQPLTPPAMDRAVKACLAKDPDERFQTAHDLKLQLEWINEGGSQAGVAAPVVVRRKLREALAWGLVAVLALVVALFAVQNFRRTETSPPVVRLELSFDPEQYPEVDMQELSPDGTRLAFTARGALWVRSLTSGTDQLLPGTDDAQWPLWSPDGRFLAFSGQGKIKKIKLSGGPPEVLCDGVGPGSWSRDGVLIVLLSFNGPLYRVSADGGTPVPVTRLDKSRNETAHYWPSFLPDGRHFLYLAMHPPANAGGGGGEVYVGDLQSIDSRQLLLHVVSRAEYVEPGYLLFVRDGSLMAVPFDASHRRLSGEAMRIADDVNYNKVYGYAGFTVSQNGVLAYFNPLSRGRLTLFDRGGRVLSTIGEFAYFAAPRLSPHGDRLAVLRGDSLEAGDSDVWVYDLTRGGVETRVTSDRTPHLFPTWSPVGDRIAFASTRDSSWGIYVRSLMTDQEELLYKSPSKITRVEDWSPDGRYLLYQTQMESRDLYALDLKNGNKPIPVVHGPSWEGKGQISPDGRWIAYVSDESGRTEVYVRPFLRSGEKVRVSLVSGDEPRWRRDGKEIVYVGEQSFLFAAPVTTSPTFTAGTPQKLFTFKIGGGLGVGHDVSQDGKKILVIVAEKASGPSYHVIVNWPAALKQ